MTKLVKRSCVIRLRRMSRQGSLHNSTTNGLRRRLLLKMSWKRKKQHEIEIWKRSNRSWTKLKISSKARKRVRLWLLLTSVPPKIQLMKMRMTWLTWVMTPTRRRYMLWHAPFQIKFFVIEATITYVVDVLSWTYYWIYYYRVWWCS